MPSYHSFLLPLIIFLQFILESKNDLNMLRILSSDGATLSKIIATLCVVFVHSYKLFGYMKTDTPALRLLSGFHAIAACGVPVFFLLSGYFLVLKDNWNWSKNIKKKLKSLAVPYGVFILLYALISCIGSLIFPRFFDDFRTFTPKDWVINLFGIPFIEGPHFYGPLWFVRDLFILNILAIFLVPVVKKTPGFILVPAMILLYFLPISQFIRYPIVFFILGMYFGFRKEIPVLKNTFLILLIFVIGFSLPIVFTSDYAWKISVLLMTALIIFVSEKLVKKKAANKLSHRLMPYSFPIYLLHEYPMTTLMRLLALKHISFSTAVIAFFIAPFIVISLCVLVIVVWKRVLPKTYAAATGGRV